MATDRPRISLDRGPLAARFPLHWTADSASGDLGSRSGCGRVKCGRFAKFRVDTHRKSKRLRRVFFRLPIRECYQRTRGWLRSQNSSSSVENLRIVARRFQKLEKDITNGVNAGRVVLRGRGPLRPNFAERER